MCDYMFNKIKHHINVFSVTSILAAFFIVLPLFNILLELFTAPSSAWLHIREHLLAGYVINTIILIVAVGVFSGIIGTFSAYVVTRFEFKGRKVLSWFLILPLAMPSYIAAYVYADMTSYTGTFSRFMRSLHIPLSIDIMSMPGAIFIFVLTLYPYVYLMVKGALSKQSASFIENARLLGASKVRILVTVVLPLLRPAMIAGMLLVVLETLNDYGVVAYFNIRVFSFAIFDAWFRLGDIVSAIRLSAILMIIVFAVVFIERMIRGKRRYTIHIKTKPIERVYLKGYKKIVLPAILWVIMAFAFFVPVAQLLWYATKTYPLLFDLNFIYLVINSLSVALTATFLIVFIALMLANFNRGRQSSFKKSLLKITNLGYAIPGAVIAVAVLVFFIDADTTFYSIYHWFNEDSPRLLMTSSLLMLIFAYVLRFMAIGYNSIEASYDKIGEKFTEAAYLLKTSKLKTLLSIDLPLIKSGLISAAIIVFIDVIKELPLTLILRPTNYETLASQVYKFAREEMLQEAAIPSLVMISLSSLAIYIFTHRKKKGVVKHVR